jgi:hypothetical protein
VVSVTGPYGCILGFLDRSHYFFVTTFADRGCSVVSVTDPYGRILDFLDRSHYFFFQVAQWTLLQTHYFSENLVVPGI